MTDLYKLTIAEVSALMTKKKVSPIEIMDSFLARSKSLENTLHVWVTLDEDKARSDARHSLSELEKTGPRTPLHGIPIGIKDIYYTKGVATTFGSPIYTDFVPKYDATSIARLRRAGAIIMGKTVTTEFACMDPSPTRNPWNAAHTPGGSSSGSAAGVAAHMFPGALGSQTAGSVLRPASYNGVVGFKPTLGRISRHGVFPVSWSLDTMGCFTRTVEDAAILLQPQAGRDPKDQTSSYRRVPDYWGALKSLNNPRIGVVNNPFVKMADPEVQQLTDMAIQKFIQAGAIVEEIRITTDLDMLIDAHGIIMAVEAASVHQDKFKHHRGDYGAKITRLLDKGISTRGVDYADALRSVERFKQDMRKAINGFDALLTPTTTSPAPRDLTTTGDPIFQTPWTTCGFPATSIPSGLSRSGVPVGIQLVSAPFREETLLATAHWCEKVLNINLAAPV